MKDFVFMKQRRCYLKYWRIVKVKGRRTALQGGEGDPCRVSRAGHSAADEGRG
jgi:hypothetical protein